MHKYTHSPKVIIITGPRASGKTTVAKQLAEELGYHHVWMDGINGQVRKDLNLETNDMYFFTPKNHERYNKYIGAKIKEERYTNLVIEGDCIRSMYIYEIILRKLFCYYGQYAIIKQFSLAPNQDQHYRQYALREIQRLRQYYKKNHGKPKEEHSGDKRVRQYDVNLTPDPPGFERVDSAEDILAWARQNRDARHPSLPAEHADLIQCIAESGTYTPFYQTVEVGRRRIIEGIFDSKSSWENLLRLNPDFRGKSVVDLGAMHGYFSFKIEELGASEVVGLELNPGSVNAANEIAKARGSRCTFQVCNVETDPLPQSDMYIAMNMLHWIKDVDGFLDRLSDATSEILMEIGEVQIRDIVQILRPKGFKAVSVQKSHRPDKKIGQRYLFRFADIAAHKQPLVPVARNESASAPTSL